MELRQDLACLQGEQNHWEVNYFRWRGVGLVFPANGLKVQDEEELEVVRTKF